MAINARLACGLALWFYPTIGAVIAAGVPWLTYSCPSCQQVGWVDLRTLDRHLPFRFPVSSRRYHVGGLTQRPVRKAGSPIARFATLEMLTAERP
jgi:hypothetical protein